MLDCHAMGRTRSILFTIEMPSILRIKQLAGRCLISQAQAAQIITGGVYESQVLNSRRSFVGLFISRVGRRADAVAEPGSGPYPKGSQA
jgi:hypothetical protein